MCAKQAAGSHHEHVSAAPFQPFYLPSTSSPHSRSRRQSRVYHLFFTLQRDVSSTAHLDSTIGICLRQQGYCPSAACIGCTVRPQSVPIRDEHDLREIGMVSRIL